MKVLTVCVLLLVFTLSGCGDHSGGYYYDDHHDNNHYYEPVYTPVYTELKSFNVVDSNGRSSEFTREERLELNPYRDDGLFEIYWETRGRNDYYAEFRINDRPTLEGSLRISHNVCGDFQSCGYDGMQYCRYNADFSLSCNSYEPPDVDDPSASIAEYLQTVPDKLYLMLEVCGVGDIHCEFEVLAVTVN